MGLSYRGLTGIVTTRDYTAIINLFQIWSNDLKLTLSSISRFSSAESILTMSWLKECATHVMKQNREVTGRSANVVFYFRGIVSIGGDTTMNSRCLAIEDNVVHCQRSQTTLSPDRACP